jgi:tetratricopeptide (TPR) repeat protein
MDHRNASLSDGGHALRRDRLGAAGVAIAALVMGLPTIRGGFVGGDDHRLALNHVYVNHPSFEHTLKLFTTFHRDLYQPLPLLSFQAEFAVTKLLGLYDDGPEAFAWLFHLDNALLHTLNAVFVYVLLLRLQRRMSGRGGRDGPGPLDPERSADSERRTWSIAALAALLFAVHPLQTEVVAWLNGRMFLLSTLFGLGSLLAFTSLLEEANDGARRDGGRGTWWAVVTIVLLLCSALSKVRAGFVVLFVLLVLVHRPPVRLRLAATWCVCALLTGVFIWVNIAATSEAELFSLGAEHLRGPRLVRVLLALAWYFQHFVWPVGLASYYPTAPVVSWSDPDNETAGAIVAAGLIVMALAARRSRVAAFGAVWFFAAIVDTLPFVPARNVLAADRYIYVPIIGLLWPTAAFLCRGVDTWRAGSRGWPARYVPRVAAAVLCVAFVGICWHMASFYETSVKKTGRVATLYPDVPRVAEKLGWAYFKDGDYRAAIAQAKKELQFDVPEVLSGAHQLMGMAELELGNHEPALALLRKALEIDPESSIGKYRLAMALDKLGRYAEARPYYEEAVAAAPAHNPTIHRLAGVYRRLGRPAEARALYEQELENNAFEFPATMSLVELDLERGTPDALQSAHQRLTELLDWMPENLDAWVNLAAIHAARGRSNEAVGIYARVLARAPHHQTAALNLAQIYYAAGDVIRAAPLFEAAVEGAPPSAQVAGTVQGFRLVHEVYAALRERRYADATESARRLCEHRDASADDRARLLRVLERYDQERPGDPWTYCLVAQLTLADARSEAAGPAIDLCAQHCAEEACLTRVRELREQIGDLSVPRPGGHALPERSD